MMETDDYRLLLLLTVMQVVTVPSDKSVHNWVILSTVIGVAALALSGVVCLPLSSPVPPHPMHVDVSSWQYAESIRRLVYRWR